MTPALHIKLLGTFELCYGEQALHTVSTPRLQSLLAYFVLRCTTPQQRQHLAFLFWPDSTEAQARTNLRRELHNLRRALPDADTWLRLDGQTVQWRLNAPYTLDVAAFEHAVDAATPADVEQLAAALALYRGELLPGCYDEWLVEERERLSQKYLSALDQLVATLEEQRDYRAAIRYAEQLLRHDPLHEPTSRRLMRLHALNNDRASALRVYHACTAALQHELGVEPEAATRKQAERLLHADETTPPPRAQSGTASVGVPLVGRQREWQQLRAAWQAAAAGRSHAAIIAGEAGIGKTRLAEELLHWATQQGIATARARAYAAEGRLAYAPVIDWLRSDALRPGWARLDSIWLTELARLLPELLTEQPALARPAPLTESWQRQRLFEALARATLASGQPLLLLLDDLQWCDQETLEWLRYLLRFDPTARLLLVGTLRGEEVAPGHAVQSLLNDLRLAEQVTEMTLGPLDNVETIALATQIGKHQLAAHYAEFLYRETEGHPLFVVEMTRAGTLPTASHVTAQLPPKVQTVIAARLAQLSPEAHKLAHLAATIGRAFSLAVLAHASDCDEATLVHSLDELWQRHIAREQSSDTYDFSHDKIREVAYAQMSVARRRMLHRRVAQALEAVYAAALDAVSGQIAAHYERAGLPTRAIPYYERAAAVAQHIYANEEAIGFLQRGLALLETLPVSAARDEQELALQTELSVSLVALKGYAGAEVRTACTRARALCEQMRKPFSPALLRVLALTSVVRSEFQQAYELGEQLLDLAQEQRDSVLLVEAQYVLGVSLFWLGAFAAARAHLELAIAQYDPQQHQSHLTSYAQAPNVISLIRLAYTLWFLGYPEQAARRCQEALVLARELAHPFSLGYALNFATWLARDARDTQMTEEWAEATVRLATEQGFAQWLMMGTILQGWVRAEQGDVEQGIDQIRSGMAAYQNTGARLGWPYYLALLAQAQAHAGAIEQALATIEEALVATQSGQERWFMAELLRLNGELLLLRGEDAGAAQWFRKSIEIAQQQGAKSLELRAATSLARVLQRQSRSAEARETLAAVYGWFTEGFDTPDLREARAILDAVS